MLRLRLARAFVSVALALSSVTSALGADAGVDGGTDGGAGPVVLQPLVAPHGLAVSRFRLSHGGIVQMHSGCSEWSSGGGAFLVQPPGRTPRVITFESGPARELRGGVLLLEERTQVGADGDPEAPLNRPPGSHATQQDATGSIFAFRVRALPLGGGAFREAGWDTFAPVTAGAERFVVLAHTRGAVVMEQPREPDAYQVLDVRSGQLRELGKARGPLAYRTGGDEVFVRLAAAKGARFVAVNGTTGQVRPVAESEALRHPEVPEEKLWPRPPVLSEPEPGRWEDAGGRPIRVTTPSEQVPHAPRVDGCGVSGPYWSQGLLFTDEGAFPWPEGLQLKPPPPP